MVDGPLGSAVSIRDLKPRSWQERYLLLDRGTAEPVARADWRQFPVIAKAVATGVDLHEVRYFGRAGAWVNTMFALALVWLCVTSAPDAKVRTADNKNPESLRGFRRQRGALADSDLVVVDPTTWTT